MSGVTVISIIVLALLALVLVLACLRALTAPDLSTKAVTAELAFLSFLAMVVALGIMTGSDALFDLVLVAAVVGFLSVVSLARLLNRGQR